MDHRPVIADVWEFIEDVTRVNDFGAWLSCKFGHHDIRVTNIISGPDPLGGPWIEQGYLARWCRRCRRLL